MRKQLLTVIAILASLCNGLAQTGNPVRYHKSVARIPMRDGVKLFTVILSPVTPPVPRLS
jgi:predicted acyl esterase